MKRLKKITLIMILLLAISLNSCKTPENEPAIKTENMDLSVSPEDDFDNYANGGWKQNNPLPDDKSRFGTFDKLRDEAEKQLQTLFDKITSEKHQQGSIGQKIADFYNTGMDTAKIEERGIKPLIPYFNEIENCNTIGEIQDLISIYHKMGLNPLFSFFGSPDKQNSNWVIAQLYQGGLGLNDRDYYLNKDKRSEEIRSEYVKHIEKMFLLAGQKSETASTKANRIMTFETRLAKASMTRLERRNPHATYNKMDMKTLIELSPEFQWEHFFSTVNLAEQNEINVGMPLFFKEISIMINEVSLEEWKDYLTWELLNSAAAYLSSDFVEQNFHFYGKVMKGQKTNRDRWKRVQGVTNTVLSEAIGQLYVDEYFPPEAKTRMVELVENLKVALGQRIDHLDWMSDTTKIKAHEKLKTINVKIGYPDKWRNYSQLNIKKDSYFENIIRYREFSKQYNLNKINKPVDKMEWHMPPQMVNAYYSPQMNEIVFPAAILQPPFFYLNADDAVNYGAIGVVIGHEITHGFDDQGKKYDKNGNLNDWWTKDDALRFEKRAAVLEKQFNEYIVLDSIHADGKLTLGENIADLGGLNIALQAFRNASKQSKPIDGFTPEQRFFLAYSHLWAGNVREKEILRLTKEDVHSLGRFRVLGPLRNMPEFYDAFNIKDGDYMHLPKEERAVIW